MANPLFPLQNEQFSPSARRFLLIGVWSLAIAGIFSLIPVVSRTPGFCDSALFARLFREALVIHVDLSVLVWFLSMACVFFSLKIGNSRHFLPYIKESAAICFILGMLLIAASPLDSAAQGLMSNYIPVITSPIFFIGLSLILCGLGLMLFASSYPLSRPYFSWRGRVREGVTSDDKKTPYSFAVLSAGIITAISIFAFIASFKLMPPQIDGVQYYELGFWGGGHILQFVHTQFLMLCWLWLATTLKPDFSLPNKFLYTVFWVGLIAALASPLAYFYEVTSQEHREFFTKQMIIGGGIAPILLSLPLIPLLWKTRAECKGNNKALWAAAAMSILLFLFGGFLGSLIRGQNIVIPAHYHGSIVGITLAFMGIAYLLLPRFGYRDISGTKLAFYQPIIYGFGQLLHISGLAYSGGYGGLQRKTPCAALELAPDIKIAMGLMGTGGLLAIIGGIMFVIVVARSCRSIPSPSGRGLG